MTPQDRPHPRLHALVKPLRRLYDSLFHSSTLETVIISGSLCPALVEILSPSPTGIVESFPPSVATLSINAESGINTLVDLVQSLPLSTGIKTLKIRSVQGDLKQLREECQERGNRLALA